MNTKENKNIWVGKVIDNLRMGGRSERTIENYISAINRFLDYYDTSIDISSLDESNIIDYIKKQFIEKNKSTNTYNMNICAIKLLYIVCFNKSLSNKLLPRAKTLSKIPSIIDKEKFLEIVNGESNTKYKCWLLLAYCSGLRVEEVAKVKIQHIDAKNHKLKVIGKRKKERYTVLPDIAVKFLRLYYKESNMTKKKGYLFEGTSKKEHCSSKAISNYFNDVVCLKYNLSDDITFHSLRHSFATNFIKSGGDLFVLKSMLGHSKINTTSIYIHIARDFNSLVGAKNE